MSLMKTLIFAGVMALAQFQCAAPYIGGWH